MSDSFTREPTLTVTAIGDIEITLFDPAPGSDGVQMAQASIQLLMSDGTVRVRRYNLVNHYGGAVLTQLRDFVADVRGKANNQILPE